MKSLGRIAYEQYCSECEVYKDEKENWVFIDQSAKDAWEATAQAIVDEYKRRQPEKEI